MTIIGINSHSLMWDPNQNIQSQLLIPLGVKVLRNDYQLDTSTPTDAQFANWVAQCRSLNIQPLVVVTFNSGLPSISPAAKLALLAKANPGLIWEYGNEIDWFIPKTPPGAYVQQLLQVTTAIHQADPTAKVYSCPPANINPGGSGWNWQMQCFVAGLASIPIDGSPFHNYTYPDNALPSTALSLIPGYIAQMNAWGNHAPYAITECGFKSGGDMTPQLQSQYMLEYLKGLPSSITICTPYSLTDSGGETFGWTQSNYSLAKPVFSTISAYLTNPSAPPNYQSLYQSAIAQMSKTNAEIYSALVESKAWLAAHPTS